MNPGLIVAGLIFVALVAYSLTGGSDFGGGLWDLLARGPRAKAQRDEIAHSIGPVWEANHVWLILVLVLLFVCFPKGYATLATVLHFPFTLLLLGVVLRGATFVFRKYDTQRDNVHQRWSLVFAVSSCLAPVMFGVSIGTIADSGALYSGDQAHYGAWLRPFPLLVGLFTLLEYAWLSAVYLAVESHDPALREDFRRRGVWAAVGVVVTAALALGVAYVDAPRVFWALGGSIWALPIHGIAALTSLGALRSLRMHRYPAARNFAALHMAWIIAAWGYMQFPWIVADRLSLADAQAPDGVLWSTLVTLAIGAPALAAAYGWLLYVFKPEQARFR